MPPASRSPSSGPLQSARTRFEKRTTTTHSFYTHSPMTDQWLERTWRPYGVADPYYAVLAEDRYRKNRLDDTARREFFKSGEEHIEWVLSGIRRSIDPSFTPGTLLRSWCTTLRTAGASRE